MGTKSAIGMGAPQTTPGYEPFQGSPTRFNAQRHIRKMITTAQLPENVHRNLNAEITGLWTCNTAPMAVISFVETFLYAYREKHPKAD